jgi:hypothetical protein
LTLQQTNTEADPPRASGKRPPASPPALAAWPGFYLIFLQDQPENPVLQSARPGDSQYQHEREEYYWPKPIEDANAIIHDTDPRCFLQQQLPAERFTLTAITFWRRGGVSRSKAKKGDQHHSRKCARLVH